MKKRLLKNTQFKKFIKYFSINFDPLVRQWTRVLRPSTMVGA